MEKLFTFLIIITFLLPVNANPKTPGSPVSAAATAKVRQYTSILIMHNNPVVSYKDFNNNDFKNTEATYTLYAERNEPDPIDSPGNTGRNTTLIQAGTGVTYLNFTTVDPNFILSKPECINPTVPILSSTSFTNCGSVSTTLSISTGTLNDATQWQWYSGSCGGSSIGVGSSVIVSPAVSTTYFARGEGGCVTPGACASITITVNPNPVPSISGGAPFCTGGYTILNAVSGYSAYIWSTGETTQNITVNTASTFTVTVTDTKGCTGSAFDTTSIHPVVTASISGGLSFCAGSSTILDADSGYVVYNWSTGAATQNISVNTAGTYTVTVTDGKGCTGSASATTTIGLPPFLITGSNSVCPGSSDQWCSPAGPVSYLWSTGAGTPCITVNLAGTYTVTITDIYGCSGSCSKTLIVSQVPICSITGNASICSGSSAQWCATGGLASYLWSNGATTQCITVSSAGTYSVTATSDNGCVSICNKTLTVKTNPPCSITGTASICPGSSTQWCAPGGLAPYLWNTGATTKCINVSAAGTYTVSTTNTSGCTSSCSKTLTLKNAPGCTITGISSICPGSSAQWCAPAGLAAYLWSTGETTQCISVSTAGIYKVTTTNTGGCTNICNKTLTIKSAPACTITGTASICPGTSTQWCAPAGLAAYLWSTGATTKCITVSISGTYTVTTTNTSGCTSSCSKTLVLKNVPGCTITGTASTCPGSSAQWCAPAGLAAYLWSTGATTQCITVSTAGTYKVTTTNTGGCTSSCSKTLTVKTAPACSITGNSFCQGSSSQLCAPSGATGYLWSTGTTTQCVTVNSGGTYTVTVTSSNGCTNSCSKTVIEYALPECSITGDNFCNGSSTQLCAAAAAVNTVYLWSTGETTQCSTLTSGGTYTVTVTDANGCTNSCSKTVIEYALPECSITGDNFCNGSSTQLCAAAADTVYLWSTGETTQCITLTSGGTYTVTVTDANGCTNSCSKTVIEYALPECSITGDNFCNGSSTQLCAAVANTVYLWSTGETTQCITLTSGGTYTVTVTDANGCTNSCSKTVIEYALPECSITGDNFCNGSSTQLCATANSGYLWSTGETTQCITLASSGTYTVTVTYANGCTNSCSKTVIEYALPECSITGDNLCNGSSTQLCAAANSGYLWSTGETTQCITLASGGTYIVTVMDANGCTSSCSKTAIEYALPECSITGGNFCLGSSSQLCASPAGANYLWSTGAVSKCITVSIPGTYTVTVTDVNGCSSSCTKIISANPLPPCVITWTSIICQGDSGQFCASAGLSSYLWNTGATTQCITINTTQYITVTVTNGNGCTNSCTVKVLVQAVPVCSITGNSVVQPGQTTQLCAPNGLIYLWNNGTTTKCLSATAGTYTVTVTGNNGCTSSCSVTVITSERMTEPLVISGENGAIEASAYPNPFNQQATIEFRNTKESGHAVVELFNLTGSKIAVLFDKDVERNVTYQAKVHSEDLAEGVYFYRIVSGDNIIAGKLILLKE